MKAPTNIQLHRDGHVIPLSAIYIGEDMEGQHVWEIVGDIHIQPGDKVTAEIIPPHTTIRFP